MINFQHKRMVSGGVKISSDVAHVFINGVSKEAKEKTTSKPINHGSYAGKHLQKYVQILIFPIQN